ncbi:hypothetical protein ILUMI_21003 [Ignelater luminosus]|uniref:Uncharacterized protein n=1 Tax=Ignelater luminosus TaxID=2038154 RepID=A0A8K0CD94_IGNLU|nr:hypothetical protein ILUMI_21003 [Ignelater luminosus]
MKLSFLILLTYLSLAEPNEASLDKCKCFKGYKAIMEKEGPVCVGLMNNFKVKCNMPEPPRCECSGSVIGIQTDREGKWCLMKNSPKRECENRKEWRDFYEKNPGHFLTKAYKKRKN